MAKTSLASTFGPVAESNLAELFNNTEAAGEREPLPRGRYECRLEHGERFESRNGTPGFKFTFTVIDGEHADRKVWHDVWLTPKGMEYARRDLAKVGVTTWNHLPVKRGFICAVNVVQETGDDGRTWNKVDRFDVLRFEPPAADPFAPKEVQP